MKKENFIFNVISLMFFFVFYQQVMVINFGGSFKIYEFLAGLLLLLYLFSNKKKIYGKFSLILFIFFIIGPILGNIMNIFLIDSFGYYNRFPKAQNVMRFNSIFSPIFTYIYYLLCWITINYIIGNKKVYENREKVIKIFLISGTIISIYSLYGMVGVNILGLPDIVPSFIDFRNSQPEFQIRPAGFSAEPGIYVLVLMWLNLYLIYYKNLFSKMVTRIMLILNISVFFLTLSSMIVPVIITTLFFYIFTSKFVKKIKMIVYGILFFILVMFMVEKSTNKDFLYYSFYYKLKEFVIPPTNTLNSGAYRNYTSRIGLEIFKESPLWGIGPGNSYFYMWKHEYRMGIENFGERLQYSSAPQNSHVMILAEMGIFGYILFILFYISYIFIVFIKVKKSSSEIYKIGFIGGMATFIMLLSIYPVNSLFIWINIALVLNSLYFEKRSKVNENSN